MTYHTRPDTQEPLAGGVEGLCTAILIQAVKDYQDLNNRGITSRNDKKSGSYSKNEIARFFNGSWCEFLLESIGSGFSGAYILSCLQAQKSTN